MCSIRVHLLKTAQWSDIIPYSTGEANGSCSFSRIALWWCCNFYHLLSQGLQHWTTISWYLYSDSKCRQDNSSIFIFRTKASFPARGSCLIMSRFACEHACMRQLNLSSVFSNSFLQANSVTQRGIREEQNSLSAVHLKTVKEMTLGAASVKGNRRYSDLQ